MNNKSAEWQHEFYLTHDKYRMQRQGTDCYKVVKGLTRILQLPTIAKLTTDNESVISDFRLNSGEYGLEPYDEYAIKVDDTYGASLYILVHRRADTTFLCPILVGFEGENTCAMVMPTDNWRMREMATFVELRRAEKEFGVDGLMMAVNTRNGVYSCLSVLNESGNLLERWLRTERDSLHIRNSVTAPSSAALILQIWLHTICLWKRRCLSRKVEQRIVHANGEQESVKDVRECLNISKQTIVDLKKGIVVYVNDGRGKRYLIEDAKTALQAEAYLSAMALTFAIISECANIEYPDEWFDANAENDKYLKENFPNHYKNGKYFNKNHDKERFQMWIDDWENDHNCDESLKSEMNEYVRKNEENRETRFGLMPEENGELLYQLRCSILHEASIDIEFCNQKKISDEGNAAIVPNLFTLVFDANNELNVHARGAYGTSSDGKSSMSINVNGFVYHYLYLAELYHQRCQDKKFSVIKITDNRKETVL